MVRKWTHQVKKFGVNYKNKLIGNWIKCIRVLQCIVYLVFVDNVSMHNKDHKGHKVDGSQMVLFFSK